MDERKGPVVRLPRAESLDKPPFWRIRSALHRTRRTLAALRPKGPGRLFGRSLLVDLLFSAIMAVALFSFISLADFRRNGGTAFVETSADCRLEAGTIPRVTHAVPQADGSIWLGIAGTPPYDYTHAWTLPPQWRPIVLRDASQGLGHADLTTSWDGRACRYQAIIHLPPE